MDIGTILELLFALAAVALVLYLSFVASKYLAKKINNISQTNNIKILERVSLMQDKGLAIAQIGRKYFFIGYSTNSIEILQELSETDLHFPSVSEKQNFIEILNSQIKSRLDLKMSGKDKQKTAPTGDADSHQEEE